MTTNSILLATIADIHWQIGGLLSQTNNESQQLIYSDLKAELNQWQILITGLAQLYILGVPIDWEVLSQISGGKKITLPTYPFQRSVYWLE